MPNTMTKTKTAKKARKAAKKAKKAFFKAARWGRNEDMEKLIKKFGVDVDSFEVDDPCADDPAPRTALMVAA